MYALETWWIVSWIISNSVVAVLIAICALAADRVWRRPALSHILWVLVLIKLLTPPIVTLPIPIDPSQLAWLPGQSFVGQELPDARDAVRLSAVTVALSGQPQPVQLSMLSWVLALWAAGAAMVGVWIWRTARRVRRVIETTGCQDPDATRRAQSLDHRSPPVWLADAVISPMLVGAGSRAKIVFPLALWNRLDDPSRRSLLVHEVEHWRRRDSLVRYLEATAWIVLWWHPLVWIARQQIEDCEERCCDLVASNHAGTTPRIYAEAILATLDFLSEPAGWQSEVVRRPIASTLGRVPQIEQRLREIMATDSKRPLGKAGPVVIAAAIILLPLHPALVFSQATQPETTSVVSPL